MCQLFPWLRVKTVDLFPSYCTESCLERLLWLGETKCGGLQQQHTHWRAGQGAAPLLLWDLFEGRFSTVYINSLSGYSS